MSTPRRPIGSGAFPYWCRICAVAAMSVLLLGMTTQLARAASSPRSGLPAAQLAAVPQPADDPFYNVPPNIGGLPNGTILASRQVQAYALAVPIPARAWQVKYKTIDQRGNPSAYVTTILVPIVPWLGHGPRPLLSYQAAIDALSTKCAPSYVLRSGVGAAVTGSPTVLASNPETEIPNIEQALAQGWVVAVPDWEGPLAEWISGTGSAHGVLDGIRAAQAFAPDGLNAKAPIGMIGYSGGALATDWAMQAQPSYAPNLRFAGVALGGTPAEPAGFASITSRPTRSPKPRFRSSSPRWSAPIRSGTSASSSARRARLRWPTARTTASRTR